VKLLTKNLSHSCGRRTLDDWRQAMGPRARLLYDRFERLIGNCGDYSISPAKTRIAFLARVRFAGITKISEAGMTWSFAMPRPLRSPRFLRVKEVVPGWWVHELRAADPSDLDGEAQAWLRESYHLMGRQGRLPARRRS
jgi:hypothetical protein